MTRLKDLTFAVASQQAVERQGLVLDVVGGRELGVDGDQVVDAGRLEPVAGIIDDRNVRVARRRRKIADSALHLDDAEIDPLVDDIEPRALQQRRYGVRIVERIGEHARVLVFGVADNERDATKRQGVAGREHGQ